MTVSRWCVPLATAAALCLGAPPAASAAPAAHRDPASGHPLVGPHRVGGTAVTSTNWAGYAASGSTYTSISAHWSQPAVTCSSGNQYSSFWVGLDGYASTSVEQTGTEADCDGSTPSYYAWYEMYPGAASKFGGTVKPGDAMSASVTYQGGGRFRLTLADSTRGWSASTTQSGGSAARASAEVIAEAPFSDGVLPLADFGAVRFTGADVNGAPIGEINPTQISMVSASGTREADTSALTGGEDFSATWKNQ